jgi:hypothetical protein
MRKISLVFLGLLFFLSCAEKGQNVQPSIEKERFTQLLLDIRLVEAMYSVNYRTIDENEKQLDPYFLAVFKKHQTTREAFAQSYEAYLRDGEVLLEIEKEVGERLAKMQAESLTHQ